MRLIDEVRALVLKAEKTVSGRLGLADQLNALLDAFPAVCDHEWSDRGTDGDRWRECWLCGEQEAHPRPRGGAMTPCPYHSTLANGMRLYGPRHACFTVYDRPDREEARDE